HGPLLVMVSRFPKKYLGSEAPKNSDDGTSISGGGVGRAVPTSETVSTGVTGSSEAMRRVPGAGPATVGVKVTVRVRAAFGTSEVGVAGVTVYGPVVAMLEMLSFPFPIFLTVTLCLPDMHTATLPNVSEAAEAEIFPGCGGGVKSVTASDAMEEMTLLAVPSAAGVPTTLTKATLVPSPAPTAIPPPPCTTPPPPPPPRLNIPTIAALALDQPT